VHDSQRDPAERYVVAVQRCRVKVAAQGHVSVVCAAEPGAGGQGQGREQRSACGFTWACLLQVQTS
jgi:hypothetical protein